MSDTILVKLVQGEMPTEDEIFDALYDICDRVHASCDDECPVYRLCSGVFPRETEHGKRYGCDGFKSGKAMAEIIRSHKA